MCACKQIQCLARCLTIKEVLNVTKASFPLFSSGFWHLRKERVNWYALSIPFVFLFFSFLNFTETLFKVNERFYNKQQENLLFHDFRTEKDDCQVGDDQPKRGLRAVDEEPSFGARIDECQRPVVIVFHWFD